MKFDPVSCMIEGDMEHCLPRMAPVRQHFLREHVPDVYGAAVRELERLNPADLAGKRIAVTAGSRRISGLVEILRGVGDYLRHRGACPFIVPAMGSHGNADAEGQRELLEHLGITGQETGMEIVSCMDTVYLGETDQGCPVYCDKTAAEAEGIVVCGRIKPHTSITGPVESGLCKMMVVGLGKHKGATAFHRQGYHKLAEVLPAGGRLFLEKAPVLCGLGIVENAFDETLRIEAIRPEDLIQREGELLLLAKQNMPRFLLDEIDVLIVDRMGKDISGAGMDPNITGRTITPLVRIPEIPIRCIVVLGLTAASHGNANGIGAADLTTCRVADSIDFGSMYTNILTSGAFMAARLPVVLKDDETAIRAAACCTPGDGRQFPKIVHIRDTLHMTEIEVSENYAPLIEKEDRISLLSPFREMQFDAAGTLLTCFGHQR